MYPVAYRSQYRPYRREMQRPFPLVNVKDEAGQIVLEVMAPGRKKEDFTVEVKNDVLVIASQGQTEFTDAYRSAEFRLMPFRRSFRLTTPLDTENIVAQYTDGILHVRLPKLNVEPEKPAKTIVIQ
jgi:HSP20 family protein